jgi:hypothetical protein
MRGFPKAVVLFLSLYSVQFEYNYNLQTQYRLTRACGSKSFSVVTALTCIVEVGSLLKPIEHKVETSKRSCDRNMSTRPAEDDAEINLSSHSMMECIAISQLS